MSNDPPLRCAQCGNIIERKPKAKIPKFCPQCRNTQQEAWKQKLKDDRTRRVRGR